MRDFGFVLCGIGIVDLAVTLILILTLSEEIWTYLVGQDSFEGLGDYILHLLRDSRLVRRVNSVRWHSDGCVEWVGLRCGQVYALEMCEWADE